MVAERPLVIVHHGSVPRPGQNMAGQPQHIVRAAALPRHARDVVPEVGRIEEMLLVGQAARRIDVMREHLVPEEHRGRPGVLRARQLVPTRLSDHLGNEGVRMLRPEIGLLRLQRVDDVVVVEELRQPSAHLVPGDAIQVPPGFGDAAELVAEHQPAGLLRQPGEFRLCPMGHIQGFRQGHFRAGQLILVDEAGENLVQGVPRGPDPLAPDVPVDQFLRESAQVAVSMGKLHFPKPEDQAVPFRLEGGISGRCVLERAGAQYVPCGMPAELAVERFPAAQLLHGHIAPLVPGPDAGRRAEAVQEPVHVDAPKPGARALLILLEGAVQQADVLQREPFHLGGSA